MSMFHVGQRVVCISDATSGASSSEYLSRGYVFPVTGCVYTIRFICPIKKNVLLLEEIFNRPLPYRTSEPGFGFRHFRPVKDTSIEVFRKLLAPLPEKADA